MELINLYNFIHVASAVVWAGGAFFVAWFVSPAARAAGPAAGPFMGQLTKGNLSKVMMIVSATTFVSGLLMWTDAMDGAPEGLGQYLLVLGALAGIAGLVIGHGLQARTAKAMGALAEEMAGNPPTQEQGARMAELQGKMMKYGNWLAWLMIVAVIGMSLGAR